MHIILRAIYLMSEVYEDILLIDFSNVRYNCFHHQTISEILWI